MASGTQQVSILARRATGTQRLRSFASGRRTHANWALAAVWIDHHDLHPLQYAGSVLVLVHLALGLPLDAVLQPCLVFKEPGFDVLVGLGI